MATLNVIYRIAADVSSLEQNVAKATQITDRIDQKLTGMQKTALSLGNALGSAFAGAAVADGLRRLVTESVKYADALTNLHAKTQISLQGLQRLESIGVSAGVSMERLARAAIELSKNLDNRRGIQAIEEMGLNYDRIRSLKPEAQFIEIAKALAAIDDPVTRANVGTALFGRTFADVAGAFEQDVDKIVAGASLMSDAQIEALDRAGDAWDQFTTNAGRHLKGWLGTLVSAQMEIDRLVPLLLHPAALQQSFLNIPALPKGPGLPVGAGPTAIGDESRLRFLRETEEAINRHAAAVKKAADEQARWNDRVRQFSGPAKGFETDLALMHFRMELVADATLEADQRAIGYLGTLKQFTDVQIPELPSRQIGTGMGTEPAPLPGGTTNGVTEATNKTAQLLGYLGQVDTVLSGINNKWAQMATVAVRALNGVITSLQQGDWIGAMVAGVSGLIGLFGKLFGKSEESARVSPLRDEFFKLHGGLEKLNPLVFQLSGNLKLVEAVLKAKTVEQYNSAMKELTDLLQFQTAAMATLDETAKRYGFTLDELGPALQRQHLDEQAQQLFKDYSVLKAGGIDLTAIHLRMADSVNAYLKNAIQMGVEVPIAMKPMLDAMVQQGVLTDAAGNKIGSLEDAGISFAMTMSEGFKALIEEVQKLTRAIAVGLGIALESLPDPTITIHAEYDIPDLPKSHDLPTNIPHEYPAPYDFPTEPTPGGFESVLDGAWSGGLVTAQGVQRFAAGGRVLQFMAKGTDTVPAMLTPGEVVLNKDQQRALGSSMQSGGTTNHYHYYIDAIDVQSLRDAAKRPGGLHDIFIEDVGRQNQGRDEKLRRALRQKRSA